uniref:3beta-hydroxysteroid-dehydrogenase/decarboxylase isoform 2 n=1 Tax=Aegilops tauschii TaxID=37682 RepID=M8BIV8_AEGTA
MGFLLVVYAQVAFLGPVISYWFLLWLLLQGQASPKQNKCFKDTELASQFILFYIVYIIGDGNNYYDFTYVENVAYGHVCADKTLSSEDGAKRAAGKAYFVTNVEPIKFWEFMSLLLDGLGYQSPSFLYNIYLSIVDFSVKGWCKAVSIDSQVLPFQYPRFISPTHLRIWSDISSPMPSIKIPVSVMMPLAHVVEWTYKSFCKYGMKVPQLTPSRIRLLSCNRTFSCSRAKDQLGWAEENNRVVFPYASSESKEYIKDFDFAWEWKWFGHKIEKLEPSNFHISQVVFFLLVVSILSAMSSEAAFKIGFKAYEKWEDTIDSLVGDACSFVLQFTPIQISSRQKQT